MAKFCIHCGSKLGDSDKFCMHCGAKCADMTQPAASAAAKPSASQAALEKAEQILLSSQAIPDYSQALVYLVEAKKRGVKTKKMETLMLLDQLYRTIDMLRQSYTGTENNPAGTQAETPANRAASQPASHTLLEHRQHSSGMQQPTNSGNRTSNMGTYMKAAVIGAVTGAVANTLMGHHDVQARDDMLNLMRSDDYADTADDDADSSDTVYDENDAESTDYAADDTSDDSSYDDTATDTSYEENGDDDWTDTDDSYDDSDTDSSFDYDDGGDDFF